MVHVVRQAELTVKSFKAWVIVRGKKVCSMPQRKQDDAWEEAMRREAHNPPFIRWDSYQEMRDCGFKTQRVEVRAA